MRLFTCQIEIDENETVTRTLPAASSQDALRLMKAKFPDARSIQLLSSQEKSIEQEVEDQLARAQSSFKPTRDLALRARQRFSRGLILLGLAFILTYFFWTLGFIVFITPILGVYALYELIDSRFDLKRAKQQEKWEMEQWE